MRVDNSVISGYGVGRSNYKNTVKQDFTEMMSDEQNVIRRYHISERDIERFVSGESLAPLLPIEGAVYSGGFEGGTFRLLYADESTEENPCMIAEGIDEKGKAFRKKIFINDIDPRNATYVEMTALECHLNKGKSVPSGMRMTDVYGNCNGGGKHFTMNGRYNFLDDYQEYMGLLAQHRWPGYNDYKQYIAEFERNMFAQFHNTLFGQKEEKLSMTER